MPAIPPSERHDSKILQRLQEIFSRRDRFEPYVPSKVLAHDPELLKLTAGLERLAEYRGDLEPSLAALVKVRVAQAIRCKFCIEREVAYWSEKNPSAASQLKILQEGKWREYFGKRELLALEYVERTISPSPKIPADFFERLKEVFNYQEIVTLAVLIGIGAFCSCLNRALGDDRPVICAEAKAEGTRPSEEPRPGEASPGEGVSSQEPVP